MTHIAFNTFASTPQGVFKPMLQTDKLDVKLAEGAAGKQDSFNHVNRESAETYVILQGDYRIRVGPKHTPRYIDAGAGDVFSIPRGYPHGDITTQNGYRLLLIETPPRNLLLKKITQAWSALQNLFSGSPTK